MLAIKLRRIGKKKQPFYRLVVAEKRSKVSGWFVEDLGFYNPHSKEAQVNGERAGYWIEKGAQPTETAWNILVSRRIVEGEKTKAHSTRKRKKHKEREAAAIAAKEKLAEEEVKNVEGKEEEVVTREIGEENEAVQEK